ncbi:DUF2407 C-terminal domain-containing protein [Camillea tinctor]|nr:DUF2407 C-terminal domain-containing protein [Camillea tinctor]
MTTPTPTSPSSLKPPPPAPPPLLLTIRFSASIPDLELDIPRPGSTTVISLKHLIRSRLNPPNSQRRLRFIHGGKILPDSAVLSAVLRAPIAPPPTSHNPAPSPPHPDPDHPRSQKGKSVPGRPDAHPRVYVNCSIGDDLSAADLESEAQLAAAPAPTSNVAPSPSPQTTAHARAAPRGFDRLLSAGFTPSEVNQLRLQFRSIHASHYTPDSLPSPDGFRRLEEAWIDGNGSAIPVANGSSEGLGGGGGIGTDSDEEVGLVAMVDVLIRGVVTGFVWPLGSAGWLIREEGMASGRWRFMVGVGVLFSVLLGMIRAISGDK